MTTTTTNAHRLVRARTAAWCSGCSWRPAPTSEPVTVQFERHLYALTPKMGRRAGDPK